MIGVFFVEIFYGIREMWLRFEVIRLVPPCQHINIVEKRNTLRKWQSKLAILEFRPHRNRTVVGFNVILIYVTCFLFTLFLPLFLGRSIILVSFDFFLRVLLCFIKGNRTVGDWRLNKSNLTKTV